MAWQANSALAQDDTKPESANERIVMGVMGVNGRGGAITKGMLERPNTEIGYICDVDTRAAQRAAGYVEQATGKKPKIVTDFRQILDDKDVDALVVATPNHWHAPATILACGAGKHVYVEKPCSHTAAEGEWAMQAARDATIAWCKRELSVELGRQSWRPSKKCMAAISARRFTRVPGTTTAAHRSGWANRPMCQIGWIGISGKARRRAVTYKDNVVHYNWHWHWHWGNGELGNNGVHGIDVARWGLDVKFPHSCHGRWRQISVRRRSGNARHDDGHDRLSRGKDDHVGRSELVAAGTYTIRPSESVSTAPMGRWFFAATAIRNFDMKRQRSRQNNRLGWRRGSLFRISSMRFATAAGPMPTSKKAHRSTLLCHLGNIAYRTGSTLHTDPANGHIIDNPDAQALWSRDYADGWEPKV